MATTKPKLENWATEIGAGHQGAGLEGVWAFDLPSLQVGGPLFSFWFGRLCAGLRAFRQLFVRAAWLSWQSGLQGIWDTRFGTRRRASSDHKTTVAILLFPGSVGRVGDNRKFFFFFHFTMQAEHDSLCRGRVAHRKQFQKM